MGAFRGSVGSVVVGTYDVPPLQCGPPSGDCAQPTEKRTMLASPASRQ